MNHIQEEKTKWVNECLERNRLDGLMKWDKKSVISFHR